jgi:hypothetical protein
MASIEIRKRLDEIDRKIHELDREWQIRDKEEVILQYAIYFTKRGYKCPYLNPLLEADSLPVRLKVVKEIKESLEERIRALMREKDRLLEEARNAH